MSKQLPKPTEEEKGQYMSMTEALQYAESKGLSVTRVTLISWVGKHKLGMQPGGTDANWYVYKDKFMKYIDELTGGDNGATATN